MIRKKQRKTDERKKLLSRAGEPPWPPKLKCFIKSKNFWQWLSDWIERKEGESRSVSRVLSRTVIPLRQPSLTASSNLPGPSAGHAEGSLFGLAPSGVYLATDCCQPCGALLPHLFTLTGAEALRRLFSVALSVGSRLPGVTWHFALWSPDFPPLPATAAARSSDCPIDSPPRRVLADARHRKHAAALICVRAPADRADSCARL